MPRYFVPSDADELAALLDRLSVALLPYADVLDLSQADFRMLVSDREALVDAVRMRRAAELEEDARRRWCDYLVSAAGRRPEQFLGPPAQMRSPAMNERALPGVAPRLRALIGRLAEHAAFTPEIADDLGLTMLALSYGNFAVASSTGISSSVVPFRPDTDAAP